MKFEGKISGRHLLCTSYNFCYPLPLSYYPTSLNIMQTEIVSLDFSAPPFICKRTISSLKYSMVLVEIVPTTVGYL